MIKMCTKIAKLFYNKISQEEDIDNGRNSGDGFYKSDNNDNSTYNSEETPIN